MIPPAEYRLDTKQTNNALERCGAISPVSEMKLGTIAPNETPTNARDRPRVKNPVARAQPSEPTAEPMMHQIITGRRPNRSANGAINIPPISIPNSAAAPSQPACTEVSSHSSIRTVTTEP